MSVETDKTGTGIPNPGLAAVEGTERGGVLRGIVATSGSIAVIDILSSTAFYIPNAGVACLLAVAYAAYTGGTRAGLVSAALASLYVAWNFSIPGEPFHFSAFNFNRLMVFLVIAPAMAFMVGALRRRSMLYEKVAIDNAALRAQIAERKHMEDTLRESETRFRQLAENIREVFWVRDVINDRILYVSPAYEHIWGRKLVSFDEAYRSFQESIHPEDRTRLFASMERETREETGHASEYRIARPDGAVRWIRSRSFPIRDDSGTAYRIVGVAEDVTDTKQAEEERLSQAISQREILVREVHHRIKNNLQAVVGLLMQEIYDHPELEHALKTAVLHVQMIAVVHGIQADPEADGIALCEMTPAIARNVESLMQSRIRVNVKIEMPRPAKVREKESVPVALILNELLVNAVKHSPEAAASREIEVTISRDGSSALIRIVSQGNLPPQFNFAAGVGTGTGLGLVRSLMPRKGAELTFHRLSDGVVATLKLSAPVIDL